MRQVDRFQRDLHQYVHTDAVRASEAAAPELFQMGRPVPEVPFPTCELCVTSLPHWIKELVRGNYISTHFVGTKDNLADLYTKPVPYQAIDTLLTKLCGYDHTWETFPNTTMKWASTPQSLARAARAVAHKFHTVCNTSTAGPQPWIQYALLISVKYG